MRRNNKFLSVLTLCAPLLLGGCNVALMNPAGPIAEKEKALILIALVLMLLVVVPVIIMTIVFAIKYRASNTKAEYKPDWAASHKIEMIVWGVPCLIVLALCIICWNSTHALDPKRPLESSIKPLEIDVVALNWRWLFIYPEQHIATINEISIPVGTPVKFVITSETVMNSFFIPRLGSQIYAMNGMESRLNLVADKAGVYDGISANFSGAGFSWMNFKTYASSQFDFNNWVAKVKQSSDTLTQDTYADLTKPSEDHGVHYYSIVDAALFDSIVNKYMSAQMGKTAAPKIDAMEGMEMPAKGE